MPDKPILFPSMALSIRQPWANRILHDGKDVENRDWPTRFRGPVLIHTGKRPDGALCRAEADLPLGGIVGVVEIVDCVTSMDSRWFYGPYGFVLRNPRPLAFVSCRGRLGFFRPEIDPALLTLIDQEDA